MLCNLLSFISIYKIVLQLLSSQCCSSHPENSMTPFDTIISTPSFLFYRDHQYSKQLWIFREKQNNHAELSIFYPRRLLTCAMTFVLGKSQFSLVCNFLCISQTPGAFIQVIPTLWGSLSFSTGLHSRQNKILKKISIWKWWANVKVKLALGQPHN